MNHTDTATQPGQDFLAWRAAVDAAAALRAPLVGRRVQWQRRLWHEPDQALPTGVIKDVTASGFKVLWDASDRAAISHPDDLVFI